MRRLGPWMRNDSVGKQRITSEIELCYVFRHSRRGRADSV